MTTAWLVQYPSPLTTSITSAYAAFDTEAAALADAEARVAAGARYVTYFALEVGEAAPALGSEAAEVAAGRPAGVGVGGSSAVVTTGLFRTIQSEGEAS